MTVPISVLFYGFSESVRSDLVGDNYVIDLLMRKFCNVTTGFLSFTHHPQTIHRSSKPSRFFLERRGHRLIIHHSFV